MGIICNIKVASPSAPELIQDLLVANGDALPVQALCRAGALIGVRESAIRVALNRLVAQGKITHGARGFYAMNASGPPLIRAVDGWQHEGKRTVTWSGTWLGVQDAGVLRSDKTGWRHHGLALDLCGFRLFQPGLHLRPDNLVGGVPVMRNQLQELGLAPQAAMFRIDDLDAARQAKALALWKVEALSIEYENIRQALKSSAGKFTSGDLEASVRESLLLGRAAISRLVRDPLLPPEIADPEIRQALTKEMKGYQSKARILWRKWLEFRY